MDIQSAQQDGFGAFVVTSVQGTTALVPDDPNNVDRKALQAWVAAGNKITPAKVTPPPLTDPALSLTSFMALLTASEQTALASCQDPDVKLFLLLVSGAGEVVVSAPQTQSALAKLMTLGVLTKDRVASVNAGLQPES